MTKPTPRQIVRTYNTSVSRQMNGEAFARIGWPRSAARRLAGARRARRRMVRLMAEYLGVGEIAPWPRPADRKETQIEARMRYPRETSQRRPHDWPSSAFHQTMSQDRTFP